MSLTITKMEGSVSIGAQQYAFSVNGSGLIFDVDHAGAVEILRSISPNETVEEFKATPSTTVTPVPEESSVTVTPEPVVEEPPKKKRGRKKKVPEIEASSIVTEASTIEEVVEKLDDAGVEPDVTVSSDAEVPDEIKNARQLKGIVAYFMDLGMTDAAAITAECEKYKEAVPLLSRATNLQERVERILVLIGVPDGD